jgi:predicted peptidase
MVVFFGGSGEMGGDTSSIFRQKTIFSKITSKDFQSRYPCYLYVPHLSSDVSIHTGIPSVVNDDCRFLVASIMQYVEEAQKPKIDRNRICLTGLSKGGSIAFGTLGSDPKVRAFRLNLNLKKS